jgi:hypothetical protein
MRFSQYASEPNAIIVSPVFSTKKHKEPLDGGKLSELSVLVEKCESLKNQLGGIIRMWFAMHSQISSQHFF